MTTPDAQDPRLLSEDRLSRLFGNLCGLDLDDIAADNLIFLRGHITAQAEMIAALEEQLEPRPKNDAPLSEVIAKLREIGKDVDWAGAFNDLQEEQRQSNAVEDGIKAARAAAFEEAAKISDAAAEKNKQRASREHDRSSRYAKTGYDDRAEQSKITAQALDAIADEATYIATAIRALSHQENL